MRALAVLALALLIAGCVKPAPLPPAPPDLTPEPTAAPASVEVPVSSGRLAVPAAPGVKVAVVRLPFHKTVDAAKSLVATYSDEDPSFYVDATGASAIVLELAWNSTVFDLDPNLVFTDCDLGDPGCLAAEFEAHWLTETDDGNYWVKGGSLGAPDGPVRIVVDADALASYGCAHACKAFARAITKDAAVDVDGQLVVSVFYGTAPPAGYSALR